MTKRQYIFVGVILIAKTYQSDEITTYQSFAPAAGFGDVSPSFPECRLSQVLNVLSSTKDNIVVRGVFN